MTDFAWVIEAPGQNYLGTREIGHHPEFYWTRDHARAVRFISAEQAEGVMMAVRRIEPKLWAFAANLGEARPVEHGWIGQAGSGVETEAEALAAEVAQWRSDNPPDYDGLRVERERRQAAEAANTRLTSQVEKLMEALRFYMAICGNTANTVGRQSAFEAWEIASEALRTVYDSIKEGLGEAAADAGLSGVTEAKGADPEDALAAALYNLCPFGEQPTDLDGRPTGPGGMIPWANMDEYAPEEADRIRALAKRLADPDDELSDEEKRG